MSLKHHFEWMAIYNQWMNAKLYEASSRLDAETLHADKGAFFGSVFGTLHHLLRADTIGLKHFANHPAAFRALEPIRSMPHPYAQAELLHAEFDTLRAARLALDDIIISLSLEATDATYQQPLTYTNRSGRVFTKALGPLMQHFFNHQTHHRGQATTLLSQAGIDVGVTDLLALVPDE
ncbi:DinB family protein [Dyella subtropica]|uniref:DinB family protein n=1 Tax=Dyella subtropica TaxID=2992127 RepID=UPI00224D39D7|nr:DinB family protein [Dyella subtropica]